MELDEKQSLFLRYSSEIQECSNQKATLKQQVAEYESKIKSLLSELEAQSKRHISEVNKLHEEYMGYKSQAAELKTRCQMYQQDHDQTFQEQRDTKKAVLRLTFQNDELTEKLKHMDFKFHSLVSRFGASQEEVDQLDQLLMSQVTSGNKRGNFLSSINNDDLNFYAREEQQKKGVTVNQKQDSHVRMLISNINSNVYLKHS